MLRDWLKGAGRSLLGGAALLGFVAAPAFGQAINGKIQGRVTDAATGAPIAGAQVTVANTTLGNITNDQGFYFINEVPAGLHDVQAQFIGYRPLVIAEERILAGHTTTMNFELEQTALELEAITVEGERNPLVPRDQTTTKSIVRGETIDLLPLDNATSIVVLQAGVIQTNSGRTFRGSRPNEEAVFVDGVLVRNIGRGTSDNVEVPTNALEQVDVTVGAFSAEFSNSQSGVVSFVTRQGGPRYSASLEAFTDQLGPDNWRTNFNRLEATFGGPIAGPLTFFLAGTLEGREFLSLNEGSPPIFVQDGFDTCDGSQSILDLCAANGLAPGDEAVFPLARSSAAAGAADLVDVAAPRFIEWDNGRTRPFNSQDEYLFLGNLAYQFARGSRVTLGYTRNRNQRFGRGTSLFDLFQVTNSEATFTLKNVVTLGAYIVAQQSANSQIALDLRASYQKDNFETGILDPNWDLDHRDPTLGFTFSDIDFFVDKDDFVRLGFDIFDPSEEFINTIRSGAFPQESLQVFPGRSDLVQNSGIKGVDGDVRGNPYATRGLFNIAGFDGFGDPGLFGARIHNATQEERWVLRGNIDWQIGRFNRLKVGGEFTTADVSRGAASFDRTGSTPERAEPDIAGFFVQDKFDVGDLVIEAGLRWDYLKPNVEYPRVPGFVSNVPDSLKAGFVRLEEGRFVPLTEPCNGASVCKSNFIEGETKSEFSPRLGVSFPVTPTSTFRLSFGRFVQIPAFLTGASTGTLGLARNVNNDLKASGLANTNTTFARDIVLPDTRQFEFGYRQLIGQDLVIDVAAYNKKSRNGLTFRNFNFPDPNIAGRFEGLNVLTNADFTETNGLDAKVDKAIGNLFQGSLSYSFIDAKGTGSDPFTFTGLILRAVSNLARLTGERENPPEVLLPLEQSRRHNISVTTSLAFPDDFAEGTVAGQIFRNFGLFTVLRVRSGLLFTKLENRGNGQMGPPTFAGLGGTPESGLSNLATPWRTEFDLRATKGFRIGGVMAEFFADWRNPFNLFNTNFVFLETGNTFNGEFRRIQVNTLLSDSNLDGDSAIDDFDILAENPENDLNKFLLLRAEERFGDGDGVFTVEEQEAAFNEVFDLAIGGEQFLANSNQNIRLGFRLSF